MMTEDESLDFSAEIGVLDEEKAKLQPEYDRLKGPFEKADKALNDLLTAQEKRRVAAENAARQAEIAAAEAEATKQLLRQLFRKEELQLVIDSTDETVTEDDKFFAQ